MSTPMSVDSEEEVTSASGSMPTPMMVDSVSGSCSEMMKDPVEPQARSVHDMIVAIRDVLPRVTSNMNQCERIADRFKTVGDEAMKSMELQEGSKLFKILRRGQILVQGYADTTNITAREISNGDNRDEFREFHEELHYAWAERGFPSLPKVEESVLQSDAENDKMAIEVKMEQRKSQSSSDEATKKQAQVVLDKTKNMDEFGPGNMPSYLAIDSKSSDVVIHHVPVKPKKSDEFVSELPVYLSIDRNIPVGIDNVRAGRPEWKPKSLQDPVEEVGWVIVHPGKWLGCDFAIKVFKCNAAHKFNWNERELKKEVQSLVALQHPHVVRFVGFGQDEERCLFLMELMDGDLKKFMAENVGRFDKLDVINQIAKGMYYMHERDYVHGDLKCTNILVKKLDDRVLQVKIGDLRGSQNLKNWNRDAFDNASKIRRPRWTAPEVIDKYGGVEKPTDEQLKQLKQSDVYSFGMTCYEIVTGKLPYQNIFAKNGLLDYIREGRVEEFNKLPDDLDEDLKGMIRRCWRKEPSERPTSAEICQLLKTASSSNRVCAPMLSFGRSLNQLLKLWSSNTSSVNSGSHGTYPHVNSGSHGTYPHVAMIPQERLERSSTVKGSGVAGEVFKATWLNCTVAVKKLKNYPKSPPNAQQFPYEVQYLIEVSHHPCTVQLIGLSEYAVEKYEIVMEYVKMNLRELVDIKKKAGGAKGGPFKFEKALLIITKLALGMVYLHSRGLVHRDLKPQNVLVVDYSENVDVKIADFGESHLKMITGSTYGYFDGVGSRFYRAPEVFRFVTGVTGDERLKEAAKRIVLKSERGKLLNEAARRIIENLRDEADLDAMKATDVYSFGMVCYMVLTGEDPYCDLRSSDYEEVWNGIATLRWTSDTHLDLKLLVERCVQLNPTERPTFEQICQELHKISLKSN